MNEPQKDWSKAFSEREEQRQLKRMAVLHTGARMFSNRGFDGTTLNDIASELNVSKRTLYYYVKNKEDILFECNRLGLQYMEHVMEKCRNSDSPPLERITAFIQDYALWLTDDMGACIILSRNALISEKSRSVLSEARIEMDELMRDMIKAGVEDGSITPCDVGITTAAIFGALNWIPFWNRGAAPISHEEIADHFTTIFINGLRTRGQRPS